MTEQALPPLKDTPKKAKKSYKWYGLGLFTLFIVYLIQDIVVTNVLGAYYCSQEPNPNTFVKQKIEYPESIYWEDNVYPGFNKADRKIMIINYLDGKHLKKIALNGDDGNIYVYEVAQDDFKSLEDGKRYTLDRYNQHAKLIMKREKIYSKETMPQMNYTVRFNPVELNVFVKKYLYSDETQIMNNQTQEVIAYNRRYMRFFYKLWPDFAGGRYYYGRPLCGNFYSIDMDVFKRINSFGYSNHKVDLIKHFYNKIIVGEK